jgi:predicted nucleotidyltransferase component of viral defense system
MNRTSVYYRQVQLLLQLIPFIDRQDCFALKGGTAINLFVRDFPRLSIDIDLVFLPRLDRTAALAAIKNALGCIARDIKLAMPDSDVIESFRDKNDALRLTVCRYGLQIKIELSPVLRGTVFAPQRMSVCEVVENEFGYAEIQVVAHADLYAGKICAALDRQHPRDLFDVKGLLENEGLTADLRKALLVYIISHPRPMAELLRPRLKELSGLYRGEYMGMTEQTTTLAELESTRKKLVELINTSLTPQDRDFLLSFKNLTPDWTLLELEDIDQLPAVRWKQQNLAKMDSDKRSDAYKKLRSILTPDN